MYQDVETMKVLYIPRYPGTLDLVLADIVMEAGVPLPLQASSSMDVRRHSPVETGTLAGFPRVFRQPLAL